MRVALYARVSTEEQSRHGISIEAQIESLRKWADEQCHVIVGEYVDPGISARKPPSKRPSLQRLLADIPARKIELILFTKLDRWTRNVKGYYQVQDILDKYHVAWNAILERYETESVNGRFTMNVLLAVSEQEADRTAERIKAIFDHKVIMGEAITGALPLGFKIADKHLVHDENAPAARAVFEHYATHGNKQAARNMLHEQYGICLPHLTITHMLSNTLYKGEYRNNPNYCEPIVPSELFNKVQYDLANRSTRRTPSGRVYLFAGLLVCAECGHRLTVCSSGGKRISYRCPQHYMMQVCDHYTSIRESMLEEHLLEYLQDQVKNESVTVAPKKQTPRINKSAVEGKLSRLKDLYVDGDITRDKYVAERDRLTAMLSEKVDPPQKPKIVLGSDFVKTYADLQREQKKTFWREIIDHIDVDVENHTFIYFR